MHSYPFNSCCILHLHDRLGAAEGKHTETQVSRNQSDVYKTTDGAKGARGAGGCGAPARVVRPATRSTYWTLSNLQRKMSVLQQDPMHNFNLNQKRCTSSCRMLMLVCSSNGSNCACTGSRDVSPRGWDATI